ncbi:hypothetical protein [Nocardia veterana]|uniref:DUF8020 domain-containing protein n=1 Tax=Nocardia veterana TaxID=132249 RepID=A0A7X6M3W5_9NOCA|nr:hypothetical protein [Nocardia veterana]NKY89309.1 hypothetical protein [Nocardia veterana]
MNKTTRLVSGATLALMVTGAVATTAHAAEPGAAPAGAPVTADPFTLSTEIFPGVRYTSNAQDGSVSIQTGLGSLTTVGAQFQVKDSAGALVAGTALTAPPKAEQAAAVTVDRPTPQQAAVQQAPAQQPATEQPVTSAQPIYTQDEFNSALSVAATQFGLATGIGSLAGGLLGGVTGCALGATVGAVLVPEFFLASGPAGCLVGAGLGATIGPLIGAAVLGIPVGIASAVQMYNTLNAPAPAAS